MGRSRKSKKVASPYSTGGGGPEYEDHVGAYYLAMMLLRAVPRGKMLLLRERYSFSRFIGASRLTTSSYAPALPKGK